MTPQRAPKDKSGVENTLTLSILVQFYSTAHQSRSHTPHCPHVDLQQPGPALCRALDVAMG